MGTIISFMNNKGGVGKTASTEIIAELLVALDKNVLIVDLDAQSNASLITNRYGKPESSIRTIFSEKLKTYEDVRACIQQTDIEGLDIIASCLEHADTQTMLNCEKSININIILKRALDTIRNDYDYIIIDNAPANDSLAVNSIIASDYVFIPAKDERLSYEGAKTTLATILTVKEEFMVDSVKFGGVFLNDIDLRTNIHKEWVETYKNEFQDSYLNSSIRKSIRVKEMESNFIPVMYLKNNLEILIDYSCLLLEMNILNQHDKRTLETMLEQMKEASEKKKLESGN